jgi:nitroreductase
MDFDKILKERHSVRRFKQTKKVDYRKVIEIIEAGTFAPLAGNIYSLKYILVQDKEKIKALSIAAQQDFVEDVDYIIVLCSDKKALEKSYFERGAIYSRQQSGAIIENMLLKITELGLASCWIGAFSDETVKRILKIPGNIDIEAMLPIGIEFGKGKQQTKPSLDRVLVFDEWGNKFMKPRAIPGGTKT